MIYQHESHILHIDSGTATIYHKDRNGEVFDLNAEGEPIRSEASLRSFIGDLVRYEAMPRATAEAFSDVIESSYFGG